jgi:hypothetical protein
VDAFVQRYPSFQLADELLVEGGEMLSGAADTPGAPREPTKPTSSNRVQIIF